MDKVIIEEKLELTHAYHLKWMVQHETGRLLAATKRDLKQLIVLASRVVEAKGDEQETAISALEEFLR